MKYSMKKLAIFLFLCISTAAFSQDIVFSQDVRSDTVRPTKGPNLKHFTHPYFRVGFPVPTGSESNYLKIGLSPVYDLGMRYKRRFNNFFAMGLDLSFNWAVYSIDQKEGKSVPDSLVNKKEKLMVNSLSPAAYLRFNVGRRGNFIGKYLDLGAFGSWNYKKAHLTVNKNEQEEMVRVMTTRLSYMESFSYGLLARVGSNRWALSARYRLNDLFTSSFNKPELPKVSLGFEIGLFK